MIEYYYDVYGFSYHYSLSDFQLAKTTNSGTYVNAGYFLDESTGVIILTGTESYMGGSKYPAVSSGYSLYPSSFGLSGDILRIVKGANTDTYSTKMTLYTANIIQTPKKGVYEGRIVAGESDYPLDGVKDGKWYVRRIKVGTYLFQDGEEIKKYGAGKISWSPTDKGAGIALTNSNLTAENTTSSWSTFRANTGKASGKWYWEIKVETPLANIPSVGIASSSTSLTAFLDKYSTAPGGTNAVGSINGGDLLSCLLDMDDPNGRFEVKNNTNGISKVYTDVKIGLAATVYPAASLIYAGNKITANFGSQEFKYPLPVNYQAIDTKEWSIVGTAPATKALFDSHGMTDLSIINNEVIQQLTSPTPELLCWTDEEGAAVNNLPTLTSNTTPSPYVVSASSGDASGTYAAFNSFNNDNKGWWSRSGNTNQWLQIDYGEGELKKISKYALTAASTRGPRTWRIEGSNDTVIWDILDYQADVTYPTTGLNGRTEYGIDAPDYYRYYRIFVESNNGGSSIVITRLELFESISPSRTANLTAIPHPQLLLPVGDIEVGELESVSIDYHLDTEQKSLIPTPALDENLLYHAQSGGWNATRAFDGNKSGSGWGGTGQSGYIGYKFGETKIVNKYGLTPAIDANDYSLLGMPKSWTFEGWDGNQWVVIDEKVNQTSWVRGATRYFEVNNSKDYVQYRINISSNNGWANIIIGEIEMLGRDNNDNIKTIVSGDGGESWTGHSSVNPANLEEVKANGFTPEEFNALTKEQLAELFPNGKARFAFYLEQENLTDVVEVNSLKINERQYTITPSLDDLSVMYEMLEADKPDFEVSRDDGVTWKEIKADELTSLSDLPEGDKLRVKVKLSSGQELHALSYSWI